MTDVGPGGKQLAVSVDHAVEMETGDCGLWTERTGGGGVETGMTQSGLPGDTRLAGLAVPSTDQHKERGTTLAST